MVAPAINMEEPVVEIAEVKTRKNSAGEAEVSMSNPSSPTKEEEPSSLHHSMPVVDENEGNESDSESDGSHSGSMDSINELREEFNY